MIWPVCAGCTAAATAWDSVPGSTASSIQARLGHFRLFTCNVPLEGLASSVLSPCARRPPAWQAVGGSKFGLLDVVQQQQQQRA